MNTLPAVIKIEKNKQFLIDESKDAIFISYTYLREASSPEHSDPP